MSALSVIRWPSPTLPLNGLAPMILVGPRSREMCPSAGKPPTMDSRKVTYSLIPNLSANYRRAPPE